MKRAVYQDERGQTFSAPVVLHEGQWKMQTSEGLAEISFRFQDDVGGTLSFVDYRDVPDERLHIEPKQPGQSSLQQLQGSYAKAEAQARAERQHARVEAQTGTDPRKVAEARRVANEYAALKRPHGKGAAQLIQNDESYQEFKDALNPRPKSPKQ